MTTASTKLLQCPYPGCPGVMADANLEELVVCPECRRASARCPRLGREGRCGALNRCLARYCRLCREEFPAGWAQALWSHDTHDQGGRMRLHPSLGEPDKAERVLCLNAFFAFDRWDQRPLPFLETGGWLWLGGPDGRYLLVDPFHDRNRIPPILSEQLWPEAPPGRLRARTSGMWLLIATVHGVRAVHLLGLDGHVPGEDHSRHVWDANASERVVGSPVLLRDSRNGLERLAAWLTEGPAGLVLHVAPLLVTYGRQPLLRRYTLDPADGVSVALGESPPGVVLVDVPLEDRDGLLLATAQGLWLLDLPRPGRGDTANGGTNETLQIRANPLLSGRRLLLGTYDTPHVVCLPASSKAGDDAVATVLVAGWENTSDSETLWCIPFAASGPLGCFPSRERGCVPFAGTIAQGRRQALALARPRSAVVLCDQLGNVTRLAREPHLYWTTRLTVHGRVVVCSGREAADGQARWFVELLDLAEEDTVVDRAFAEQLAAHPLLVGRYLFAVEVFHEAGRRSLWLTRRQLEFT